MRKPLGYWKIKSNREYAASCCETRGEYFKYRGAYHVSSILKELDEFHLKYNWKTLGNKYFRLIYVFIFKDFVYVGLTNNESRRYKQHITDKTSPVYKHIQKDNIFEYKLLTDYVDVETAIKLESYYMDLYLSLDYKLLCNRSFAGSLGSNNIKWNKSDRENIAKTCTSINEYYTKHNDAYQVSCDNNELDEFEIKFNWSRKHKRNNYWDNVKCHIAASECYSRTNFSKKYKRAYYISCKNGNINKFAKEFNWK